MTGSVSPSDRARRRAAAVDAAVGAARELGLAVTGAKVLHDLFSVVVRLDPAPVVVRVPTVLPSPVDLDALAARQHSELDVAQWLAGHGTPVLEPSDLVPRVPVQRDGLSMTFWRYAEEVAGHEPDYVANAASIPRLHAALRDYPGPLTFLSSAEPWWVDRALAGLGDRPDLLPAADLDRARREWTALGPWVRSQAAFETRFPGAALQPVHGDAPAANVFAGVDGDRYADFELVTLGPVEWDMATLGPVFGRAYDDAARQRGMRPLDPGVLAFTDAVGRLRALATLLLVPQLPELAGYLAPAVDAWRATPFAGGAAG
ncbi:phosphotransferase [Pseudonocardia sp. HH130630-07]|uniref:phosphotransferase n=1 Tax=Pseudonocardia sp. HH130630-07 TaxID=1690815 RepID=UPI0008153ADD|nr:phosphotransferase [Pseudonocardia sp. HH130630-07]ANY06060.1 aminoglycoside phosphotransferase [Pseudonocardia sp. HH130630-07]